jgi:PPOX class probable F420-dependent enzyme
MSLSERLAKASDHFYDRMRSADANSVAEQAPTGGLDDLRGRKYCVVTTYRKNGEAIPSPVWFGVGNGKLYFVTGASTVKLKRIERNPEVRVAPCTTRGKPVGPPFVGRARILGPEEEAEAERWLQANYGLGRRLYSLMGRSVPSTYVEVTPV